MSLTPSHIIEHLFCPRFTYFQYVLSIPQYEEKHFKVTRGRNIHALKQVQNAGYLRKKQGVTRKEHCRYLSNPLIRGEVDEILFLDDGTLAPLDYKFARYKGIVYDTYKTQMFCYAWLLEDNYNMPVNKAYLVYTRSANKLVELSVSADDKKKIRQCVNEIYTVISKNFYPKSTKYKERCINCTYRNICIK